MPSTEDIDMESRVLLLVQTVEKLADNVTTVTDEMRRTNETVQRLHTDATVQKEKIDAMAREIWTMDNASRIRVLELKVAGVFWFLGVLTTVLMGKFAPMIFQYVTGKP
jgi:hypothetical protein